MSPKYNEQNWDKLYSSEIAYELSASSYEHKNQHTSISISCKISVM